ncbi:3-ketoacyl-CoA synthase 2-like [Prosopis cineraria]|uniref:3-ketoacyl-CoA synthase 2-like n=1 Tax=Prosopis cineraria TaxID=364024 RepID=UPI00240EB192|nr:3-ketoacyl-CoA synthase 2-like [Prosopis cineraria]
MAPPQPPSPSFCTPFKFVKHAYYFMLSNKMNLLFASLAFLAGAPACLYVQHLLQTHHLNLPPLLLLPSCSALLFLAHYYFMNRSTQVYLVDFSCFKPALSCLCNKEMLLDRAERVGFLSEESLKLVRKIVDRSGLGPDTYVPEALLEVPPNLALVEARKETETVFFGAVDELLEKTGVDARDIDILVVNCSVFNPTPSLADMVVNRYKLRGNVLCYNLSGMGCSAGVLAVDLANHLLKAHPNSYALVLSTENGISSMYWGNNPSMLLVNCLFRMGGSAALLSSHSSDARRSKYRLLHTLRTHVGADDNSYNCVMQQEDDERKVGVALSKELMNVARDALKVHITNLGPLVLPVSEKLKFLVNLIQRKVLKSKIEGYVPDFKLAFEHFCIHTGGRAVLDRMQKSLNLDDWYMEPSRMALYRFGNTSSSSVWYELAYCEAKGRVKEGDRVWQMAFGSGFKCNTAVWVALKTIDPASKKSPWRDEIHNFPVKATS